MFDKFFGKKTKREADIKESAKNSAETKISENSKSETPKKAENEVKKDISSNKKATSIVDNAAKSSHEEKAPLAKGAYQESLPLDYSDPVDLGCQYFYTNTSKDNINDKSKPKDDSGLNPKTSSIKSYDPLKVGIDSKQPNIISSAKETEADSKKALPNKDKKVFGGIYYSKAQPKKDAVTIVLFELDENLLKYESNMDKRIDEIIEFMKGTMYEEYENFTKEFYTYGENEKLSLSSNKAKHLATSFYEALDIIVNKQISSEKNEFKEVVHLIVVGNASNINCDDETAKLINSSVSTLRLKKIYTSFWCESRAFMPYIAKFGFRLVEEVK